MISPSTDTDALFRAEAARLLEVAPALFRRALRTGGAWADLFAERTAHHRLSMRGKASGGRVRFGKPVVAADLVAGTGLRVARGAAFGYAATAAGEPAAWLAMAEDAAARLKPGAARAECVPCEMPDLPDLPPDAPDVVAVSEKTALLEAAVEAAFALDDRVARVSAEYHDRTRRTVVLTSEGHASATATMLLGLRVEVTLAGAGRSGTAFAVTGGACGFGHFFAHPAEEAARAAVERARRLLDARPLAHGAMPVALAGGWGGVWLHEAAGHLLEADLVAAGASPWGGRRGEVVAAPCVTLADDPTLPGGRGSAPFDDEGAPTARTTLVEAGVLRSFLTDRRHAERLGLPRTGNARRQDYRHAPAPRMTNLTLAPGEASPEELIAEIREGLYVRTAGSGVVRPAEDRFSFEVLEGRRIERGRLTHPVAGVRIEGAATDALAGIAAVGNDFRLDTARGVCEKDGQSVPVSVGMPTVLLHGLKVGGV